jgi:hypothetical protein
MAGKKLLDCAGKPHITRPVSGFDKIQYLLIVEFEIITMDLGGVNRQC